MKQHAALAHFEDGFPMSKLQFAKVAGLTPRLAAQSIRNMVLYGYLALKDYRGLEMTTRKYLGERFVITPVGVARLRAPHEPEQAETTKVRRVLQWLAAGNDLMSPGMALSTGLSIAQRKSMIRYLFLKGYVESTGQHRVTELGAAVLVRVHKTDERILARQRKGYRMHADAAKEARSSKKAKTAKARDAIDQIVSQARWHVPNSVFALGAMNA